jgi:hypothetical protein
MWFKNTRWMKIMFRGTRFELGTPWWVSSFLSWTGLSEHNALWIRWSSSTLEKDYIVRVGRNVGFTVRHLPSLWDCSCLAAALPYFFSHNSVPGSDSLASVSTEYRGHAVVRIVILPGPPLTAIVPSKQHYSFIFTQRLRPTFARLDVKLYLMKKRL